MSTIANRCACDENHVRKPFARPVVIAYRESISLPRPARYLRPRAKLKRLSKVKGGEEIERWIARSL